MNCDRRRLCYIINPNEDHNRATITPFLNDRKIQLFKKDQSNDLDQFNTFVRLDESNAFILNFHTAGKTLRVLENSGRILCNKDLSNLMNDRGDLLCVSPSGRTWLFYKDGKYYFYKINPSKIELDE